MSRNKWTEHVNEVRRQHPELSLKEAMKAAKKTYKKGGNAEEEGKHWWQF